MTKIIKSLTFVLAVAAATGGATYAMLTGAASITGITFSSASLNLLVDSDPHPDVFSWVSTFSYPGTFTNLKPGDTGSQIIDIKNTGTIDGKATLHFHITGGSDNGTAGPVGNLPENLRISAYFDPTDTRTFPITPDQSWTLKEWDANPDQLPLGTGLLGPDKIGQVKLVWEISPSAGNEINNDSITFDSMFGLNSTF